MSEFNKIIQEIEILCEQKRKKKSTSNSKINKKSQQNRKDRAKNVEITKLTKKKHSDDITRNECKASSKEKSESKKHTCRLDVYNKTKRISNASCSCSDFQARFRYYRNKEGVNDWNNIKPIKSAFDPHTKERPDTMNPDNVGYLCKHLIAFSNKINAKK